MSAIRSCKTLLMICSCWVSNAVTAQSPHTAADYPAGVPVNFVRTWDATAPEQDPNALMTRPLKDVKMATQYIDGLGRPIQTVIRQGSLATGQNPTDMVSPVEYDAFGREQYKWMPYADPTANTGAFKTNPFTAQNTFYNNPNGVLKNQGENYFYAQTHFESSPLNRVQESFAPGVSWAGTAAQTLEANRHSLKMKYWINTATDDVKMWTVTDVANSFGNYSLSTVNNGSGAGIYPAGQLYKNVTVDEHNKQVIEFKDKEGKVILKKVQLTATADDGTGSNYTGWLCTYYIYDDLGNLRVVVQPEGVKTLSTSNWQLTTTLLDEQCFRYEYDYRNRMSIKKVPGAAAVYLVYDKRDRLVMTQDGNLFAHGQWMVTLYDELNRPIQTGLWTNSSTAATHAATAQNSPNYYYPFDAATVPVTGWEKLSATHYDDYTGLPAPLTATLNNSWNSYFATASNTYPYYQSLTASTATKGLTTWTETKVLGTANTFITAVVIYDDKARPIQTQSINATGGTDVTTTQYSWAGQPLIMVQKTEKSGTNAQTTVMVTQLSYDDLGRITKTEKKLSNTLVNGNAMPSYKTIAENKYDALGRLTKKTLAPQYNNNAGLESLNYDYNIRGWLLGANRDYVRDITTPTGGSYFGFELMYDKRGLVETTLSPVGGVGGGFQYNGNIEGMVWKSKGDGEKRKYDFTYDAVNRILSADFNQYNGSVFDKSAKVDFSLSNMSYDGNGNILTMNQMGLKINNSSLIDQLTYTYQPGSNKLQQVTDAANGSGDSKLGDFKYNPSTKTATDYTYDVNGNLITDANKGIVPPSGGGGGITYNHLNLPQTITVTGKGTITYTYDAGGNKLQKQTVDNSTAGKTITTTTKYVSGLVYESKTTSPADVNNPDYTDVLQFLPQEEGRIRFIPATATTAAVFQYDYMLKDHLGNIRMVLTEEQRADQYPAATMETNTSATEEKLYTNLSATRVNKASITGYPTDNTTSPNDYVARVKAAAGSQQVGPSITLKVMAGDKFNIRATSWYKTYGAVPQQPSSILTDLVSALTNGVSAASTGGGHAVTTNDLINNNNNILTPGANIFLTGQTYNAANPKAYVNWILFDERFNVVLSNSGFDQVGANEEFKTHTRNDLPIDKNGYLYVYVSNATPNIDVYFDNLQVTHTRGPILEETHYYPFGLTMAGISSKAAGPLENKKKYNGIEYEGSFDLNIGEAFFRTHDSQLGRWWQIDPKPNESISPYSAMNNNPLLLSDPLGDTTWIYNQNGVYCGVVNDKMKNQVHYINTEGDPGKPFDASSLSAKDAKALAKEFRSRSIAFIGGNTVKDMKKISSLSKTKEVGFVGIVGKDKEIRLTALPIEKGNQSNNAPLEAQINKAYPTAEQQANLFLFGHTHNTNGFTSSDPNPQHAFGFPSPNSSEGGDYGNFLYRSNNATQKGASPALVVTPYGVTVYGSKEDYSNNTYLLYKSLK